MGKALQPGAAGPHPGEQGVVDQPVGKHQAVAIGQGQHGRQVGLKAAGKQQHPLPPQPGRQGPLKGLVPRPAAAHQPGGACSDPIEGRGGLGGGNHGGMAAQAEVVVAGQIQQGRPIDLQSGGGLAGLEAAQAAAALLRQERQLAPQLLLPGCGWRQLGVGGVGSQ